MAINRKPVHRVALGFRRAVTAVLLTWLAALAAPLAAQVETDRPPLVEGAKRVVIERVKVHSPSVEGNLEGNSADRDVIVVLPPSYRADPTRRYPVVYALHGYWIGAEQWIQEIHMPQVAEGAFALGVPEMIVVLPDSKTLHWGSVYSASVTTGDFENFIARDVVGYVDSHYRTIPRRESRGLVGHSMGGYGATRIGMKHADVFGALYVMSPGGLEARPIALPQTADIAALHRVSTPEEVAAVEFPARGLLAMSSAWSPNPNKAPLYLDLPFDAEGRPDEAVLKRWSANSPLAMLDQYVPNLRRYAAIGLEIGDKDRTADIEALHARMLEYGVENSLEIYDGDHTNRLGFRFQDHVLPFFGKHLSAAVPPPPTSPEVPGDKGSGSHPAVMEVDPTLLRHVIYRPADIGPFDGDKKLGIYVWGNGACSDDAASVRNHLFEIASHGYLVVASGFVGEELARVQAARGTPQPGAPPVMPTTTQDLVDGLDWALAQNTLAGSKYRGRIDPDMVAASGFSCGGVQALGIATSDARVKALIVQNSGLFPSGGALLPGMDLPKSALANLTIPVLYLQGGPTDIAWNNGFDDYTRINHVPIALVGLPVGHGGTYFDPHGGAAATISVDWLEWQLRGDEDAGRSFIGENCRICTVPGWTIERKGF